MAVPFPVHMLLLQGVDTFHGINERDQLCRKLLQGEDKTVTGINQSEQTK